MPDGAHNLGDTRFDTSLEHLNANLTVIMHEGAHVANHVPD